MSFGSDLRQDRERQSVSLEEIAEATRVSLPHLRALEADVHSALPGGVFNRGIVQSYCRYLGLDEALWLQRHKTEVADDPLNQNWSDFAEAVKRNRVPPPSGNRRRWLGLLAMLLFLAAIAWVFWHFLIHSRLHG